MTWSAMRTAVSSWLTVMSSNGISACQSVTGVRISRICNIDVTTLTKDAATGADLISMMVDAYYARDVAMLGDGKEVIYCNKTIHAWLHKQAMNAKNVNLTIDEYAGKKIVSFLGIPVRRADAILNTESAVTA